MTLSITSRAAKPLVSVMIALRLFMLLTIDGPAYHNSGWLCAVGGLILALPALLIIDGCTGSAALRGRPALILPAAGLIYEASVITRLVINSVSYSDLQGVPPVVVTIVTLAAVLYAVMKNGRGIGNAAKLAGMASAALLLLIIIANVRAMRPIWLMPVLSPGFKSIIDGSISTAGSILGASLVFLTVDTDEHSCQCIKAVMIGSFIALVLCLCWSMMAPAQTAGYDRLTAIARLLANGRSFLAIQLPVSFVFFLGLIAALAGYAMSAAILVQNAFSSLSGRLCGAVSVAAVFISASIGISERDISIAVSQWHYCFYATFAAVAWFAVKFSQRSDNDAPHTV